jgi:hypothetical protein
MHKIPVAVTAALLASSVVVTAAAANASPSPRNAACVTKAEFNKITNGMTRARVAVIFGTDGKTVLRLVISNHVYTTRQYPPCPKNSSVSVSYRDARVTSKSAHWGTR